MKPFTLKQYTLTPLANWLVGLELPGKQSRARNRFIKDIRPRIEEIEQTRIDLNKQYATKDDKGNPLEVEVDGVKRFDFIDENLEKFKKEWTEYLQEEYVLEIDAGISSYFHQVADMVLNTDATFKDSADGMLASYYDEWCTAFEASTTE